MFWDGLIHQARKLNGHKRCQRKNIYKKTYVGKSRTVGVVKAPNQDYLPIITVFVPTTSE